MSGENHNAMSDEEFLEVLRDRYDELYQQGASISRFIAEAVRATESRAAHSIVDAFRREFAAGDSPAIHEAS